MPRLICTYRDFIDVLRRNGFQIHRQGVGSHTRWRGEFGGTVRLVDVAGHNANDEIPTGTLKSMLRQSGFPAKWFRK